MPTGRDRLTRPKPLKPGDAIAIAAPAGRIAQEGMAYLERAVSVIEQMGFRVKAIPNPNFDHPYLAGEDPGRARELMTFFTDPEIRGILCARGGYGSQRIIPLLNSQVIRENPKIFIGSSDITALLAYLLEECQLVAFHGPNVATKQFLEGDTRRTLASFRSALLQGIPGETPACKALKRGIGKGRVKGGCLSLLVATIGTTYEIDLRGTVLFVEDLNEPPYRIDRMLTHLRHAGKLDQIEGLVFGEMASCRDAQGTDLEAMVLDLFQDQNVPILFGFPSGHGRTNLSIPLGVEVIVDGYRGHLIFSEEGVSSEEYGSKGNGGQGR